MENLAYKDNKKYTYEDLEKINDGNRYEILDGELYLLSRPVSKHQVILLDMGQQFNDFFKNKKCTPFIAPLDVRLDSKGKKSKNVVQPDLMVVCDENKIQDKIEGAPDLVVEILSKYNKLHDKFDKYHLYQKYGVREYWIIDIEEGIAYVYILSKENIYTLPKLYKIKEKIKSSIFKGLEISLEETFKNNQNLLKEDEERYNYG